MRLAAVLCLAAIAAAPAPGFAQKAPSSPVTADQARKIVPRADLTDLTDAQRGVFVEVATEVFNYAGCQDTLARCLAEGQKDTHALRMAALIKALCAEGARASNIVEAVESYYASFDPAQRTSVKADNCPTLGTGPVTLVEFSDYQCPHCAAAVAPLEALVTKDRKGQVRLCSKYFPFAQHPRARLAAACDDAVEKHRREGMAAGVKSTPTLLIDGRRNVLPLKAWYLAFTVDDELQWQREKGWKFGAAPQGRAAQGK